MSLFLDTSGLYAFMVRSEKNHLDVVRALRAAIDSGRVLRTTNYVVLETVALLQSRMGLEPVRDLMESVLPLVETHWVSESLHQTAMVRLLRSDRRKLSLVDCVSFEFMLAQGIRDVLALDPHFVDEGFRLVPSPAKLR